MRNGRGLSDQWAEPVVRPRTTERRITVHKRLVLGFAVSILALIVVTAVAVALSVRFEDCGGRDGGGAAGSRGGGGASAKLNATRGERTADEETPQPWRHSRLPGTLRPRHYDLQLLVHMDNFTVSGDVSIQLECVTPTRVIVLHADRLEVRWATTQPRPSATPISHAHQPISPAHQPISRAHQPIRRSRVRAASSSSSSLTRRLFAGLASEISLTRLINHQSCCFGLNVG